MLEKYTFKQKFFALIVLGLFTAVVCIKRSFAITINRITAQREIQRQLSEKPELSAQLSAIKAAHQTIDNQSVSSIAAPQLIQNAIIDFIAQHNKALQLSQVGAIHQSENSFFTTYSNPITLQGDINTLLQITNAFEQDFNQAALISVSLYTQKNFKTQKDELFAKLLFQNFQGN